MVGTLEAASEHPVGAPSQLCPERGSLEHFEAVPDVATRDVDGVEVVGGTPAWMRELGFPVGDERPGRRRLGRRRSADGSW